MGSSYKHVAFDGTVVYYDSAHRVIHRVGGPAIIYTDGDKRWLQNGEYHRDDGPAIIMSNGTRYWYQRDLPHRTDGPAMVTPLNGHASNAWWFLEGVQYSEAEHAIYVKRPWLLLRDKFKKNYQMDYTSDLF